jgi:type III secretion protein Q
MTAAAHPTAMRTSLVDALPRLSLEQARLQRLGFDARFERWLAQRFGIAALKVMPADIEQPAGTRIELSMPGGHATVMADLSAWPAAQLALGADDPSVAAALGDVLFAGAFEAMHDVAPGARVSAIAAEPGVPPARRRSARALAVPMIVTPDVSVALWGCDAGVHEALDTALRAIAPLTGALAGVKLVGRLRVHRRALSIATLHSLCSGDVVLMGAAGSGAESIHVLQYGTGITMQARTEVDFSQQAVTVSSEPELAADAEPAAAATDAQPLPEGLAELMLPVAFEIDTAALSLAELSSIRPGYVVELAVPLLEATVRLVCHGQTIGSGQLVAIGDQLGVRINRMTTHHDLAAHR